MAYTGISEGGGPLEGRGSGGCLEGHNGYKAKALEDPPEADEFLHVKGVWNYVKYISNMGGGGAPGAGSVF
jgi:hypothetical protein